MKFIGQSPNAQNWQTNVLTDGNLSCAYQDIPKVFENFKQILSDKNIDNGDCLALECDNSVPSALFLLYLLEEGYSFLLLPKPLKASPLADTVFPKFCRYKIIVENFEVLHFIKNEQCFAKSDGVQKVYLRTSGSTSSPKLAVHTQLYENVCVCIDRLQLSSDDKIAIPVPLFHMYGLGAAFLPGVVVGASIDLQKGANILRYLQREREFNPNVVFMTPIFCETLLKGRRSPRAYRLTVTAGDRMRGDSFSRYESLFGQLVQLYGSTEMGAIAAGSPDDSSEIRSQMVGKALQNVELRLQSGLGDSGELWCHHEYGFVGYVDENGELVGLGEDYQDGWFRTKDFGRISSEGYIEVLGRSDHSINRDGLLVFFADVEKAIEAIEGIESAVVISKGEGQRGKKMIAYCVLAKKSQYTEITIRADCFDILPQRAIPDSIFILDALPLLANGKVDRQKLVSNL